MPSFLDDVRARLGVSRRPALPNQGGYVEDAGQPADSINVTGGPLAAWKPGDAPSPEPIDALNSSDTSGFRKLANMPAGSGAYDAAKAAGYTDLGGGDVSIPNAGAYTPEQQSFITKGAKTNLAGMKPLIGRNESTGESFVMQPSARVRPAQAQSFIDAGTKNKAEIQALMDRSDALDRQRTQDQLAALQGETALNDKNYQIDKGLQGLQDQRRASDRTERLNAGQDQLTAAQNAVALKRLSEEQAASPANAFADSFLKNANLSDPRQAQFASKVAPYSNTLRGLPSELQSEFVSTMGPKPGDAALTQSDQAGKILAHPLVAQPLQEVVQQLKTVGATPENGPVLQAKIQQAIQQAVKFGADPEAVKQQIHAYLRQQFPDAFTAPSATNRFLLKASYLPPLTGLGIVANYFSGRGEDQRQALASFLDGQ
jgi:hypothetical protein